MLSDHQQRVQNEEVQPLKWIVLDHMGSGWYSVAHGCIEAHTFTISVIVGRTIKQKTMAKILKDRNLHGGWW